MSGLATAVATHVRQRRSSDRVQTGVRVFRAGDGALAGANPIRESPKRDAEGCDANAGGASSWLGKSSTVIATFSGSAGATAACRLGAGGVWDGAKFVRSTQGALRAYSGGARSVGLDEGTQWNGVRLTGEKVPGYIPIVPRVMRFWRGRSRASSNQRSVGESECLELRLAQEQGGKIWFLPIAAASGGMRSNPNVFQLA